MPLLESDFDSQFLSISEDTTVGEALRRLDEKGGGDNWHLFVSSPDNGIRVIKVSALKAILAKLGSALFSMTFSQLPLHLSAGRVAQQDDIGIGTAENWALETKEGVLVIQRGDAIVGRLYMGVERGSDSIPPSTTRGSQDPNSSVMELYRAIRDSDSRSPDVQSPDRYLNTGFFTPEGPPIASNTPLSLDILPAVLRVNIGQFWGIGMPDKPFPDPLLKPLYEEGMVELIVAVSSPTTKVFPRTQPSPPSQPGYSNRAYLPLSLPQQGNSHHVEFEVTPSAPGRHTLVVDVVYAGHLLQSRRVTFWVKRQQDEQLPLSAWPVQDAHTTFTRSTMLDPASLTKLADQPRPLTIVAEREPSTQQIGLRFYNSTGESLDFEVSNMTEASLTDALAALRKSLLTLMKVYEENNGLGQQQLIASLADLADQGRALYRQLMPGLTDDERLAETGQNLKAALRSGAVIQVAPLSARLSVPWELLYERPVQTYHPDDTRLCDFRSHKTAEDCPHAGDGGFICPHSFWGFRYIIEQLPGRLERDQHPSHQELPQWIHNEPPLSFTGLLNPEFALLKHHWQRLGELAPVGAVNMQPLTTFAQIKAFLESRTIRPHLVYLYAHGGEINRRPALQVAKERFIKINDLEAWRVNWEHSPPLLILNACDSADYSPDSFEDMIQAFFRHGAAGVIGTQCTIHESLVDSLMPLFLTSFLAQVSAGRALRQARRIRMWQHEDPRGLAYSLFAAAELRLAAKVITGN